jgi:hypothetical protein
VGDTLSIFTTNLSGTGDISFQWFRGGNIIPGANASRYILTNDDAGQIIRVEVSRTGNSGTVARVFDTPVLPSNAPNLTGSISINGALEVGNTLSVDISGLSGAGDISYRWQRETNPNSFSWLLSDNNPTYTPGSGQIGQRIRVSVSRAGHYGEISFTTNDVIAQMPAPQQFPRLAFAQTATDYSLSSVQAFERGDFARAIADVTEAIKLDPANAAFFAFRGWVHYRSGDEDNAIADWETALRLNPNHSAAREYLETARRLQHE